MIRERRKIRALRIVKTSHQWLLPYLVVPSALPETKSKLISDFKNCTNLNPSSLSKSILKSPPNMSGIALVEGWMVLLETAVVAVDGLGTCLFCDVDVTFRGRPLFRSGATGEVFMSLTGVKAEVW
ncbi:hypothetical protein TNCV_657881 [Trichonephila clavipes]|uniref:Uncharacterized protein n=1 Tax=Trichonephila clavipes TaxID=2585209 RepID=A0A8X6VR54_TRICX|nr:hypothetical protein TNCV_657881 [Trichonephila clavipes]